MADSLRTDPRHVRAARRATFPALRARRPQPGRHHPASAADIRDALKLFGEEAYYGVDRIELLPAPPSTAKLSLGRLDAPGHIILYDQAASLWRLGHALSKRERARLEAGGANIREDGIVFWPGDSLRQFMLRHVLAHELGHHVLQHERRLRGRRAARTRDHEARAEKIARQLRERLP